LLATSAPARRGGATHEWRPAQHRPICKRLPQSTPLVPAGTSAPRQPGAGFPDPQGDSAHDLSLAGRAWVCGVGQAARGAARPHFFRPNRVGGSCGRSLVPSARTKASARRLRSRSSPTSR
jgi:hypothetical protein